MVIYLFSLEFKVVLNALKKEILNFLVFLILKWFNIGERESYYRKKGNLEDKIALSLLMFKFLIRALYSKISYSKTIKNDHNRRQTKED